MWCYPYLTYVAIFGMVGIVVAMAFIPEQRQPLALGVASLAVLLVAYGVRPLLGHRTVVAASSGTPRSSAEGGQADPALGPINGCAPGPKGHPRRP